MVGEAFRAVAGPEVEFRATSKRLQTQLRRGFFVSQGTRGHSVDQRVVRDFVRTAHDYSEAFTKRGCRLLYAMKQPSLYGGFSSFIYFSIPDCVGYIYLPIFTIYSLYS